MRARPYSTSGDSTIEAPASAQDDGEHQAARDDLTQLRGIGPKTADHLAVAGVRTYSQLAALTPDDVKQILADGGFGVASADPESWPAQATLAAEGRWLALRALQAASRR
jgi:predicted flap endonuclease-1-like 5' DNA nuclease